MSLRSAFDPARPVCYVAAPYAADTPATRAWNIARAEAVAQLAVREGMAVICVHSAIPNVYGDDNDPASRAHGVSCNLSILGLVQRHTNGHLWLVERDDRTLSDGCKLELEQWRRYKGKRGLRRGPFAAFTQLAERHGLGALWRQLKRPPTVDLFKLAELHGERTAADQLLRERA